MRTISHRDLALGLLLSIPFYAHAAAGESARAGEYVYQGQLDDRGVPANGRYDVRIAAFGDEQSPQTLLAPVEFPGVDVKDGRFELRFDTPLAGDREAWLEVAVRDAGASTYANIPGRSKALAAPLIGACWSVTGDSGSNPATNFLGTTDAQPLVLRTGNAQSLRIEPSSQLFGGNPITANLIAGSSANSATAGVRGATIGGGGVPAGDSDPEFFAEAPNLVTDAYGTVSGGYANQAGDAAGSALDHSHATVGGGSGNTAGGFGSTVAGGSLNEATGTAATVGGGNFNEASGMNSTVPGGLQNAAIGDLSFAAGRRARATHAGSFIWSDDRDAEFSSTAPNQFLVRADGGSMFNRNAPVSVNDDFVIGARSGSSGGDADADLRLVSRNGRSLLMFVGDASGTLTINPENLTAAGIHRLQVGGGTGGAATLSHGGIWTNASSRTFKEGFAAIDPADVLERVLALGISRWSYIGSGEGEHVGPMAEDFHAAFGLGHSDRQIATVDADGVALAAIQGLNAKLESENAALREDNQAIRADNAAIRSELAALRALVESRLPKEH